MVGNSYKNSYLTLKNKLYNDLCIEIEPFVQYLGKYIWYFNSVVGQ